MLRYISLLFLPFFLPSQWIVLWQHRYNGTGNWADYPTAVWQFSDAGGAFLYVTGMSYGDTSYYDFLTIKYPNFGHNPIWVRRYNSEFNGYDGATAGKTDASGDIFVTGFSQGRYGYDFLTLKYDRNGDLLWERRDNGPGDNDDIPYYLEVDRNGNVYVGGISYVDDLRAYDATIIKYANSGETLWQRFYNSDSNGNDIPVGMVIDRNDNIFLAVYSWGGERQRFDYLVLKYDPCGNLIFVRRFNGIGDDDDYPRGIVTDSMNIYITGSSVGVNSCDYWTLKLDSLGNLLWERRFDRGWDDHATAIKYNDGFLGITGYSYSLSSRYDLLTVCYDTAGQEIRDWVFDGGGEDFGYGINASMSSLNERFWLVTGCSERGGNYDLISLIYYLTGNEDFRHIYDGPAERKDYGIKVAEVRDGFVVIGASEGRGSYYDYYTVCYLRPSGMEEKGSPSLSLAKGLFGIYEITGRKVGDGEIRKRGDLSKLSLTPGVYILKGKKGLTKKIVVPK